MRWRINRKWRVVMMVLMVLVVLRLSLPFIVSHHVNIVLNELEGYRGSIDNVNIHLLQGRYQIHGLKIFKIKGNAELPFVEIPITDLQLSGVLFFKVLLLAM